MDFKSKLPFNDLINLQTSIVTRISVVRYRINKHQKTNCVYNAKSCLKSLEISCLSARKT